MIQKIFEEIKKDHGVVRLNELAEKLDMDPRALAGILRTVNRTRDSKQGITISSYCTNSSCAACPLRGGACGYRNRMKARRSH